MSRRPSVVFIQRRDAPPADVTPLQNRTTCPRPLTPRLFFPTTMVLIKTQVNTKLINKLLFDIRIGQPPARSLHQSIASLLVAAETIVVVSMQPDSERSYESRPTNDW